MYLASGIAEISPLGSIIESKSGHTNAVISILMSSYNSLLIAPSILGYGDVSSDHADRAQSAVR